MVHADVALVDARRRYVPRRLSTNQNAPFAVYLFIYLFFDMVFSDFIIIYFAKVTLLVKLLIDLFRSEIFREPDAVIKRAIYGSRAIGSRPLL